MCGKLCSGGKRGMKRWQERTISRSQAINLCTAVLRRWYTLRETPRIHNRNNENIAWNWCYILPQALKWHPEQQGRWGWSLLFPQGTVLHMSYGKRFWIMTIPVTANPAGWREEKQFTKRIQLWHKELLCELGRIPVIWERVLCCSLF